MKKIKTFEAYEPIPDPTERYREIVRGVKSKIDKLVDDLCLTWESNPRNTPDASPEALMLAFQDFAQEHHHIWMSVNQKAYIMEQFWKESSPEYPLRALGGLWETANEVKTHYKGPMGLSYIDLVHALLDQHPASGRKVYIPSWNEDKLLQSIKDVGSMGLF